MRAVAAEVTVDSLEPLNQIRDFVPRVRSAGRRAKMRATTEWTVTIDQTVSSLSIEQRTYPVRIFRQHFATGRAQRLRRHQCFTFRGVRCAASELEMAALLQTRARALDRPLLKRSVNVAHF